MIDWSACDAVAIDRDHVNGQLLFRGTRVPVGTLFEHLRDEACGRAFVERLPGVTVAQVRAVLDVIVQAVSGVSDASPPARRWFGATRFDEEEWEWR